MNPCGEEVSGLMCSPLLLFDEWIRRKAVTACLEWCVVRGGAMSYRCQAYEADRPEEECGRAAECVTVVNAAPTSTWPKGSGEFLVVLRLCAKHLLELRKARGY